jgi:glycosyltransferase involved in cell wall biosynthesis
VEIYWYWPFLRQEELVLAEGVLQPGDHLVVHTTPRPADPIAAPVPASEVRASLPGVQEVDERTVRWVASRAGTYVGRTRARRRAIGAGAFDVAHLVYLNPFTDPFDLRALGRRVPLVSSVHDVVPHQSRVPAPVERRLLQAQYRNAGILVVHHESVASRLVSEFDVDPDRVVVNPLPISVETATRVDGTPPTVLFFGTFRRNKGVDVLLSAVASLRGETDASFVFAGRGFADVEAEVVAAAAGDERITVEIGYATAERKRELYAAANLVVLPYTSFASQSAVLQDAYAHHVPLVVSDVGALGETVREDGTGWVVRPGDVAGLAATVLGALHDDDARRAAAEAMRRIAAERTPARVGAALRRIYERAAASS